jgi:hypothetical protein
MPDADRAGLALPEAVAARIVRLLLRTPEGREAPRLVLAEAA